MDQYTSDDQNVQLVPQVGGAGQQDAPPSLPTPPAPAMTNPVGGQWSQQPSAPPPVSMVPQPQSTLANLTPHYAKGGKVNINLDLINQRPGRRTSKPKMIVAHVNSHELKDLDELQGGRSTDEETGLPEYSRIGSIVQSKEIFDIFKLAVDEVSQSGKLDPQTIQMLQNTPSPFKMADNISAKPSSKENLPFKEERQIAGQGEGGDSELVLIPVSLADMLDKLRGKTSTNSETGLPQYHGGQRGFMPMAQTMITSPGSTGQILRGGAPAQGTPGVGLTMPTSGNNTSSGQTIYDAFKSDPMGNIIGLITAVGNIWGGHKQHKEESHIYKQEIAELKHRLKEEGNYQKGIVTSLEKARKPWQSLKPTNDIRRSMFELPQLSPEEEAQVIKEWEEEQRAKNPKSNVFAKGGLVDIGSIVSSQLIKGPGKGQADVLKTQVPNKSYIIDATTTSNLGDGSSEAGAKVINEFVDQMKRRYGIGGVVKGTQVRTHDVPVLLSNDEYLIEPQVVAAIGRGDDRQGSRVLKEMVNNIRSHKMSNGGGLPPKAKPIAAYLPRS